MKVALAQMDVVAGKPEQNLETMLKEIQKAKTQEVDLIAFPEMCVGGYLIGDLWYSNGFCNNLMEINEEIKNASDGIAIAYGNVFVDKNKTGEDGRSRKYNAVYLYQDGKPIRRVKQINSLEEGVQPKTLLPNYRFFDDKRYFYSLKQLADELGVEIKDLLQPFMVKTSNGFEKVGFEVCEDLWYGDYRSKNDSINVTKYLIENGAESVVNLSASPWTIGKNSARDRKVKDLASKIKNFKPFYYVNNVGAQNNGKNIITFDGGSTLYDEFGNPIEIATKPFHENLMVTEIKRGNFANEHKRYESEPIKQKYDAIIRGIRHLKDILGSELNPKFVIGLSGGIDSAVVSKLLVDAVGNENVLGINMPTQYNSAQTKNVAKELSEKLGIRYGTLPIETLVQKNRTLLERADFGSDNGISSLLDENIQAKIRGTSILSNLAAKEGAFFTNNGNKVEIALGYATLYGDVGGALAPIGDLTKAEVFELARLINKQEGSEIIPEILIPDEYFLFKDTQIVPSAELKENQIDPIKFGYHCALVDSFTKYNREDPETILEWYLDGQLEEKLNLKPGLLERYDLLNPENFITDIEWVVGKFNQSVFKRVQSPPVIVTSRGAFGYDIRESQLPFDVTRKYNRLKKEILNYGGN